MKYKKIFKEYKNNKEEILSKLDKEKLLEDYITLMSYIIDLDILRFDDMDEFNKYLEYKL